MEQEIIKCAILLPWFPSIENVVLIYFCKLLVNKVYLGTNSHVLLILSIGVY